MEKLNLEKDNLKKFGITMGFAFLVIAIIIFIRHKHSPPPVSVISLIFFTAALAGPAILRPIYILWMRLAFVLGWINTRLILVILFYLLFTPMGLAIRIFRKDLLEKKVAKKRESYWRKKEERIFNPADYERQF